MPYGTKLPLKLNYCVYNLNYYVFGLKQQNLSPAPIIYNNIHV